MTHTTEKVKNGSYSEQMQKIFTLFIEFVAFSVDSALSTPMIENICMKFVVYLYPSYREIFE